MPSDSLHHRAMDLFDLVCDLAPDERAAVLTERCSGDDELRHEVESMLEHDGVSAAFVRRAEEGRAVDAFAAGLLPGDDGDARMPAHISDYRILRQIGQGGMGSIYEAEQKSPRRSVAIKVLRAEYGSPELLKRFQLEAHVLGQLKHPGIAQIYEAGITGAAHGELPFLAMELIDGLPLDEHARRFDLDVRQRLELIARVCEAVQHAHQRGIIHRDLKPSNVLVVASATDEETSASAATTTLGVGAIGQPKVLDFGIARVTDADIKAVTVETDAGQLIGTLAYMSPEQVGGTGDIDTRCDVYALGVITYELLAGERPIDLEALSIADSARAIEDCDPTLLGSHDRALRGDVETIVAKALEKDRDRRYASAAELASDIRHFLAAEPISARPVTTMYQLAKFAKRNRALVGGLAATFIALVAGLITTTTQMIEADAQRDDAIEARNEVQLERDRVQRVADFQANLFQSLKLLTFGERMLEYTRSEHARALDAEGLSDGDRAEAMASLSAALDHTNPANLAREVLGGVFADRALESVETYANDPVTEARLRHAIGSMYYRVGRYESGLEQFESARQLARQHLGTEHRRTLEATAGCARALRHLGRYDEAEPLYIEVLETRRSVLGIQHSETGKAANNLGVFYQSMGDLEKAQRVLREAYDMRRVIHGEDATETLVTQNALGVVLAALGQVDEALRMQRAVLEGQERAMGKDHSRTVIARNNLMSFFFRLDRYEEAETIARDVAATYDRLTGAEHPKTLMGRNNLGMVLYRLRRFDEAEAIFRETYEIGQRVLAPENEVRIKSTSNLIDTLLERGSSPDTESYCRELLEVLLGAETVNSVKVARALEQLGECLLDQGRYSEAEAPLRECVERRTAVSADHWFTHRGQSYLAVARAGQGYEDEARPMLQNATDALERVMDTIPAWQRDAVVEGARARAVQFAP